jgi:hypothetical protein
MINRRSLSDLGRIVYKIWDESSVISEWRYILIYKSYLLCTSVLLIEKQVCMYSMMFTELTYSMLH